ncbi:MAG TPA: ATP-dependent DNA helicase RecG [Bryobacteraceae bacterium]|nr:ATP-dependent DNA helicase RecG [Bryobacteraceae bacterium]
MHLDTPLVYVKGVGPNRAAMLEAKGLVTVSDLLHYPPFRYEDRSNLKQIQELAPGEMATVIVEVRETRLPTLGRKKVGMFEAVFGDGSRSTLTGKWFHGAYLANVLAEGVRLSIYGKVEFDAYTGNLFMMHPEFEQLAADDEDGDASLHTGRVVPIYEAAGKVTPKMMRALARRVLDAIDPLEDLLPLSLRERLKLVDRWTAVREIHFPGEDSDLRLLNAYRSPAHIRMILEEFFWLECGLELKRNKARLEEGIAFSLNDRVRDQIKAMLPFKPTGAQKRVLGEIAKDMAEPHPMNRLVQGDVGSGKTLVAAEAAIIAIENGYQVAVLAPTEILAMQHFAYFRNLFDRLDYRVVALSGSFKAKEKAAARAEVESGLAQIVTGTHAILQDGVNFHNLGLAIVDEQHRFGVLQRLQLMEKGARKPDVLVMTATPIPRTLALTLYGDLDTSVIDELPPGRKPIHTKHLPSSRIEEVWSFVQREIQDGRQAYVVYPVIEENENVALKAAEKAFLHLKDVVFAHFCVGLLHGKLPQTEKESVMARFKAGEIQILVATTVVEVGVDVPNATVMVIEQAERFGLAQLHQLRGRVGRGGNQSYCVLVTEKLGETGRERIRTMTESNDGFYIAEMDLRLRGPGEFFGTKQSGMPSLHFANIIRDRELLEMARGEAQSFIRNPPSEEALRNAVHFIRENWQRRYGLVQVG